MPLRGDPTTCIPVAAWLACLGLTTHAHAADPRPEPRASDALAPTNLPDPAGVHSPHSPHSPHSLAASAIGFATQGRAVANEPMPTVRLDCPALDEEARSALEARARAEMAADPHAGERIAVDCVDDTAVVTRQVGEGAEAMQRRLRLGPDRMLAVDDLLVAIHALRLGGAERSIGHDEVASRPPSRPRAARSVAFGPILGAGAQLWHGAVAGALGPRVGLHLSAPHGWSTDLVGAALWGLSVPSGVHPLALEASWTAGYTPIPALNLGVGANLVGLTASQSGPDSTRRTAVTGGFVVEGQVALHAGPLSLSVGPELAVLAQPIVVDVARVEVFRIPNLLAGLSMNAEGDLLR